MHITAWIFLVPNSRGVLELQGRNNSARPKLNRQPGISPAMMAGGPCTVLLARAKAGLLARSTRIFVLNELAKIETPATEIATNDFQSLGLSHGILNSIQALGYDTPTPIQVSAIPSVLAGRDLMGLAQTGTGKTAAFGLPLIQLLLDEKARPEPRCARSLILAPTRELANQIGDSLRGFVKRTPLKIVTVVGGASINTQIRNLEKGTDILIATPGRLLDLAERRAVRIDSAKFLVLDEADQMLDLGFIHALRKIASMVGSPRQTMLFSATMPREIEQLSKSFLTNPVRVEANPSGKTADRVTQAVHFARQGDKANLLKDMLLRDPAHLSLVFVRTKHGAEKLLKNLMDSGIDAASIHGNKSQGQRERAIRDFKGGEIRVLVATDVAARGIDIPGVTHVYNHDLPEVPEAYVHRIGRTARAGASGEAVSLCAPDENHLLRAIERLTGIVLDRANAPAPRQHKSAAIVDVTNGTVETDEVPQREVRRNGAGNSDGANGGKREGQRNGPRNGQRNGQRDGQRDGQRRGGQHSGERPSGSRPAAERPSGDRPAHFAGQRSEHGEGRRFGGERPARKPAPAQAPREPFVEKAPFGVSVPSGERRTSFAARTPGAGEEFATQRRPGRNGANRHSAEAANDTGREGHRHHARTGGAERAPEREGEFKPRRRGPKPFGGKPANQENGAAKFGAPSGPARTGGKPAHAHKGAGKPRQGGEHRAGEQRQGEPRASRPNNGRNRRPGRAASN